MTAAAAVRLGTFSYLPTLDDASVRDQVIHMIACGWNCAVEHVEPERATRQYWYMWRLPMFGVGDVDAVLDELAACHLAHPTHHVRVLGYDNVRQTQGLAFVVHRGTGA